MVTNAEKIAFKNSLREFARTVIEQRVAAAQQAMNNAQQAANNEEKSSAGDKYETARAMGHLEKDMHARQLTEHVKELGMLHTVDVTRLYTTAATGSVIQCEQQSFFIAAGLGKQTVEGKLIIFLSPLAPLVKLLQGKKTGDQFLFNNKLVEIIDIF
jgi:hypothetical protein